MLFRMSDERHEGHHRDGHTESDDGRELPRPVNVAEAARIDLFSKPLRFRDLRMIHLSTFRKCDDALHHPALRHDVDVFLDGTVVNELFDAEDPFMKRFPVVSLLPKQKLPEVLFILHPLVTEYIVEKIHLILEVGIEAAAGDPGFPDNLIDRGILKRDPRKFMPCCL